MEDNHELETDEASFVSGAKDIRTISLSFGIYNDKSSYSGGLSYIEGK